MIFAFFYYRKVLPLPKAEFFPLSPPRPSSMRQLMKGIFITFEGIEGCGKSTQAALLGEALKKKGYQVILTREPGGTSIGDRIRAILLDRAHDMISPLTELFLYAAARRQHVDELIDPALQEGKIVLCDRYADATTAYQGAARKIDALLVEESIRMATGDLLPVRTFLLDCEVSAGLSRAITRNSQNDSLEREDRFEREAVEFHERVREGYLAIAKRDPDRFRVIDATESIEKIHAIINQEVESILRGKLPCGQ